MVSVAAAFLMAASAGAGGQLVSPLVPSTPVGAAVAATALVQPVLRVQALIQATPGEYPARGMPPLTRQAFAHPWRLPEIASRVTATQEEASHPARCAATLAAQAFGAALPSHEGQGTLEISTPQRAIYGLDFLLNEPNLQVKAAYSGGTAGVPTAEQIVATLRGALQSTGRNAARTDALTATLAAATAIDRVALASVLAHWDVTLAVSGDWAAFEAEEFPEELRGAIEGTVLTAQSVPELGWLVVGGPGANRYDMTRIAAVFDPGGDDAYAWRGTVAGSRAIVDAAGNDTYTSEGAGGPAGALLGAALVVDMAGDDRYAGSLLAIGSCAFGVALLVDAAGNDTYTAEEWSIGAGFAGVGAVVDQAGVDLYDAPLLSQGVGGPSGFGLLLDAAGDDRYRADRTRQSVYGTPATFVAFSQGCAFGYRTGACAGIGALVDCAGNDRYECGEFGQGCGYYLGIGVLADGGGDDMYVGNRYSQGTAAHQAFGVLVDESGNDIYHGVTAASQGAAWDMSVAMLVDRGGDDHYRAGSLSQGAGAQQAIGVLVDLRGSDRYEAGAASQGCADGNQYHWVATLCPSFGMLWDAAGTNSFSSGRRDGQMVRTGSANEPESAEGRTQWGLFLAR